MSTMEDLEELSTDSDDEEYIPEGEAGVGSGSSVSEGEEETVVQDQDEGGKKPLGSRTRKPRANPKSLAKKKQSRKRKQKVTRSRRGIPDDGADEEEEGEGLEGGAEKQKEEEELKEAKEKAEKARIEDLWASFKRDTAALHKKPLPSKESGDVIEPAAPKKLKIQQTYDFAGEEVMVEKEVSADSKEAKAYFKSLSEPTTTSIANPSAASKPSSDEPVGDQGRSSQPKTEPDEGQAGGVTGQTASSLPKSGLSALLKPGSKPGQGPGSASASGGLGSKFGGGGRGGLSNVLKSLGKKPKMSTLEKTGLDWEKYKDQHELHDELAHSAQDGYLARQEFLQWSDQKQFERERNERLKRFKRLH